LSGRLPAFSKQWTDPPGSVKNCCTASEQLMSDIALVSPSPAHLRATYGDAHPPLTPDQAVVEADRCYFCHDAPCVEACPTDIDIPGFIRGIATGNLKGAATTILEQNIFGGTCARVCPTEILCERSCVRTAQEHRPVDIGALQRHATDWLMRQDMQPFTRAPATGKRVAVVGAGPAGLSCAHALARQGHDVTVFEAREKPGGLNEYGIAAYKMADDFAAREVAFILSVGGIAIRHNVALGRDVSLDTLRAEHDAVFLGLGLGATNTLGIEGEALPGVRDAVDFIAELRQSPAGIAVPRRVVVIGGGNTAIDAATQSSRLGADQVTMVYRRGPEQMSATPVEQDWAKTNNVTIRHWSTPVRIVAKDGRAAALEIDRPQGPEVLPVELILKAIGQTFQPAPLSGTGIALAGGRIAVDPLTGATSLPGVFAGGDCIPGPDLTVHCVQDGKRAAAAIHALLQTGGAANG
jgi:dihydropyrimidine dehydrogenase (NAD+) subunit PreT